MEPLRCFFGLILLLWGNLQGGNHRCMKWGLNEDSSSNHRRSFHLHEPIPRQKVAWIPRHFRISPRAFSLRLRWIVVRCRCRMYAQWDFRTVPSSRCSMSAAVLWYGYFSYWWNNKRKFVWKMNICSSASEHMFKCQRTYVRYQLNICSFFFWVSN